MRERLAKLVEHRNDEMRPYKARFYVWKDDEYIENWIRENRAEAFDPERFPHYVLIAGSPKDVPYELQSWLDVNHAVGRIWFQDEKGYRTYADNVVNNEDDSAGRPPKRAIFFSTTENEGSSTSYMNLALPLLKQAKKTDMLDGGDLVRLTKENAKKSRLIACLNRCPSALLLSVCHGAGVMRPNPEQKNLQGSLICQHSRPPLTPKKQDGYVTHYDVPKGFCLPGGIHFMYSCFGAGTTDGSDYRPGLEYPGWDKYRAEEDFVAMLPSRLLAEGKALAVVGHVDESLFASFNTEDHRYPFGHAIMSLMKGSRVGEAVELFNKRAAQIAHETVSRIHAYDKSKIIKPTTDQFILYYDAAHYVVVGDPAVRLQFDLDYSPATC